MLVKDKKPYIYFADTETSYIDSKQKELIVKDENGKNILEKIADRERYAWLKYIKSADGKYEKTFASGKNTMKDFIEEIIKIADENYENDKNAETQIYYHNLDYDWSYIAFYISKYFNGCKRETHKISFDIKKDNNAIYETIIYYDGIVKENVKKKGTKFQVYDQNNNEVKKFKNVKMIRFLDTYKSFPVCVKELGETLGLNKLDEDKSIVNGVYDYNYIPSEKDIEYCKRDVEIIRQFYNQAPEYAKKKLTLAGNALEFYKENSFPMKINGEIYNKFEDVFPSKNKLLPVYLGELNGKINTHVYFNTVNKKLMDGYTGGICQCNMGYMGKYIINNGYINKEKVISELKSDNKEYVLTDKSEFILDVNSLYPHIMRNARLPYGYPGVIDFPSEKYLKNLINTDKYYIVIEVNEIIGSLNNNTFPSIPENRKQKLFSSSLYLKELKNKSLIVNFEEFQLHKKNYNMVNYDITRAYVFSAIKGVLFDKYINKFADMKEESSKIINKYKKEKLVFDSIYYEYNNKKLIAKLFMNTLYGKFGMNPDKENKIVYYDNELNKWITKDKERYFINEKGKKEIIKGYNKYIYPAIASAITSNARLLLFDMINRLPYKYFLYCDTDSVHFLDNDIYGIKEMKRDGIIDDNILGKWKLEDETKCSIYLAPKKYAFIDKDDNLIIKCAGLPDDAKEKIPTIDKFYYGYSTTSKLQKHLVKGGYDLIPANFIIKKPDNENYDWFDNELNDYLTIFI